METWRMARGCTPHIPHGRIKRRGRPYKSAYIYVYIYIYIYMYVNVRALALSYPIYQNLPQPHGTPLTPNINNLTPFANPHGTPMVKANEFLSSDWNLTIYYAYSSQPLRKYTQKNMFLQTIFRMAYQVYVLFSPYQIGYVRSYIPMAFRISSSSCKSTLSPTSRWHTADRIDFLFSFFFHIIFLFVILGSSAQLPALSQISWFSARKPRLAQKQLHKQQQQQQQHQQQQQQTKQQTKQTKQQQQQTKKQKAAESCRPLENLSKTAGSWLAALNEVRTRCERGLNEVRKQKLGRLTP